MSVKQSILVLIIFLGGVMSSAAAAAQKPDTQIKTIKEERNLINKGNELYRQQRFADAEVLYRKALEANHNSEFASYNLATTLLRQTGTKDLNNKNNPLAEAQQLLIDLLSNAKSELIIEKASYNLGNIAFNNNNFQQSIEYYKNALRKNPSNDLARQNLRLAQKKLQEQQNNNKDQNQNNEQQKEDNKNQQQNKEEEKKQDQNKDQQQQSEQKKEENKPNPQEQQSGISDSNADKILKAMENEEAATRRRVEAQRKKGGQANPRQPLKPW